MGSWRSMSERAGGAAKASLGPGNAGGLDDLAPAQNLRLEKALQFVRRTFADRQHAEILHARAHVVEPDNRVERGIELEENVLGRFSRRNNGLPSGGVVARHA